MAQFSVKIMRLTGSILGENQHLSVETTMLHPHRGFIKLEDTLAVTENGYELFGTEGRGWNQGGTARP